MTNASRHGVKEFETIVGFDNTGEVVYSVTGTCGTLGAFSKHENEARELGAVKMASIINGYRSSWYKWDGECFVCTF